MKHIYLFSPEGEPIAGISEIVETIGEIQETNVHLTSDGKLAFEYMGATSLLWKTRKPQMQSEQRLWCDHDGNKWREDELIKADAEELDVIWNDPNEDDEDRLRRAKELLRDKYGAKLRNE